MAYSRGEGNLINLKLHPSAAPIPESPPREVCLNVFHQDGNPRRETFYDGNEFGAVRFTSS
jgi:hypothetical protein